MTLNQFEKDYPNFDGLLFINSYCFLDEKLKEQLISLNIKFKELSILQLETSFINWFRPEIGINLAYIKDGKIIARYDMLGSTNKLINFINSLNSKLD